MPRLYKTNSYEGTGKKYRGIICLADQVEIDIAGELGIVVNDSTFQEPDVAVARVICAQINDLAQKRRGRPLRLRQHSRSEGRRMHREQRWAKRK